MPAIDIRQFDKIKKKKRLKSKNKLFFLLAFIIIFIIMFRLQTFIKPRRSNNKNNQQSTDRLITEKKATTSNKFKFYTPEQFKQLAQNTKHPNTEAFHLLPSITGNEAADLYIRQIAESRGYQKTSLPVSPIVKINERYLIGDDLLQPLAAKAWSELKSKAANDQIPLAITSAYRSPEYQRELFLERLYKTGATTESILQGHSDSEVKMILSQASLPGYSRHHTGYTIDLWCEDGSTIFLNSSCFRWLSKNNYYNSKLFGWIPSYPEGAGLQGPEPEPWEYIWVGQEILRVK